MDMDGHAIDTVKTPKFENKKLDNDTLRYNSQADIVGSFFSFLLIFITVNQSSRTMSIIRWEGDQWPIYDLGVRKKILRTI